MSLVGSLEDLGLGDILQIVSLSQKSGVLRLNSRGGEGRIVLRDGKVCAATVKGEPEDLRSVLISGGLIDEAEFDAAVNRSRRTGTTREAALCEGTAITSEQVDVLRREHVERLVTVQGESIVTGSSSASPRMFSQCRRSRLRIYETW